MAIYCTHLYEDVAQECAGGIQNQKLSDAFVRACNRTLDTMSNRADLATKHAHITGTNSTISTLDEEYEYILHAGIVFFLRRMGWKSSDPRLHQKELEDTRLLWETGIGDYTTDIQNQNQADTDNDVWGLGNVT